MTRFRRASSSKCPFVYSFCCLIIRSSSTLKSLVSAFGLEYALVGLYKLAWSVFTWLCAYYFLKLILQYINRSEIGKNGRIEPYPEALEGHLIAVALFLSAFFSSIAIHQLYGECNRLAVKVKAATSVLIYRKVLRVSRLRGGAGEVVNLLSTDVTRVTDAVINFHFLWSAFLEAALIVGLAFYEVKLAAFPALAFVLLLLPVQMYLGKLTSDLNRDQTRLTTERVHIMSEILTAIKLIKFYAWEKPFTQIISEIREKEMDRIRKGMIVKTINFTVVFAIPVLIALASLGMFVALGGTLTGTLSFTVLSLYNTLRYPFFMLPMAVRSTAGAITAFKRLDAFLALDEVEPMTISQSEDDTTFEIVSL